MIAILNVFGAFAGLGATMLGLSPAEKFKDHRLTNKGWSLVFLALVTLVTQVWIQIIQDSERKAAEQKAATIKSVVTKAYSGWVKVGTYANDKWEKPLLSPLDPGSKTLTKVLSVGTEYAYYVNIHNDKPGSCNELQKWFDSTTVNVFGRGTLVEVIDTLELPCASGGIEIWAKVRPYL